MTIIPFNLIELDESGIQAIIECSINKTPTRLIIDTGASRSVIANSFVEKLNLKNTNSQHLPNATAAGIGNNLTESYKAVIPNIYFNNCNIYNYEMIIIDIEHINKLLEYLDYEKVNGILGCDFFNHIKLKIDYNNLNIFEVISPDGNGCQLIANCTIADNNMRFIIDTGASRSVMDLQTFNNLPLLIKKEINSSKITGLNSSIPFISEFVSENICFGSYTIENQAFLSMDISNVNENYQKLNLPSIDGLLGGDILLSNSVLIDFDSKNIMFQKINVL